MRFLLDTHAFLWWITDDPRLSSRARAFMSDPGSELFLSAISGWEIVIKASLGRIDLPDHPSHYITRQMAENAIMGLPVEMSHALQVFSLPDHHRDPFDRMLIAQAQVERMPILSADSMMSRYDVQQVW